MIKSQNVCLTVQSISISSFGIPRTCEWAIFFTHTTPGPPNASHNLIPERCKQIWEERKYVCKISAKDVAKLSSNVFFSPDICSILNRDLFGLLVCWTEQEIPTPNWEISWVGHWPMVNQLSSRCCQDPSVPLLLPTCSHHSQVNNNILQDLGLTYMDGRYSTDNHNSTKKSNNWQFIKITFTNDKHQ